MRRDPADLTAFVLEDPTCRRLAALAADHGREIALVGGWVRDWLLGRVSPDWDLVVTGDPAPLVRQLVADQGGGPFVPLDEAFGIYRTRLRDGLELDFAQAVGGSVLADLSRRDLTINALAVRLSDGQLLDPLNGLADLRAGLVRVPARINLADDPLRLVRVHRFAAVLGFSVDPETEAWARELAPELSRSAGERVLQELAKLLPSGRAADVVDAMAAQGLLPGVLGADQADPARLRAVEARLVDPAWARATAWAARPLTSDRPGTIALLLAALLGDAPLVTVDAARQRLRWGKQEDKLARAWVLARPTPEAWEAAAGSPRLMHRLLRAHGEALPGHTLLAGPGAPQAALAAWAARQDAPLPRLVDGDDLMQALGLKPGKHMAELLALVEEAQALGEIATRDAAIALAARGIE